MLAAAAIHYLQSRGELPKRKEINIENLTSHVHIRIIIDLIGQSFDEIILFEKTD